MEITHTRPSLSDFTSVDIYERSTPDSFFEGPSVLYYQANGVRLHVSQHEFDTTPALQKLQAPSPTSSGPADGEASPDSEAEVTVSDLEIWVSSAYAGPPSLHA